MQKSEIGKLGIWAWIDNGPIDDAVELAQAMEDWGYGTLWVPEAVGRDPFINLSVLARETSTLKLATGIANIYARDPMAMTACRNAMDEISGGRLVLGLGVSHREMVTGFRHHDYTKPLSTMRDYLKAMSEALYLAPQPEKQGLIVLAALRDKMVGLAGTAADGAHPYFVTPEHTARAREILGSEPLLAPEQKVLFVKDPSEARAAGRQAMSTYLGLTNYRNNLLTLGFTEEDFEHGGSDRLVDAIVAWGDETAIMKRVEAHWANGADHVAIQPLLPSGDQGFDRRTVEALAPAR